MDAYNFMWLFILIPVTGLLTVSFFVLFALQKAESNKLKSFGRVIAMLLWICAALVLLSGIYAASLTCTGFCPLKSKSSCVVNPHKGIMMDPHHEMMDPHHGIQMDPHHQFMMEPIEEAQPEDQK